MTDRELLELAAKAAGLRIEYWAADNFPVVLDEKGRKYGWNPLVFDSDALRLAVALRDYGLILSLATGAQLEVMAKELEAPFEDFENNDPCAATRRVITRAAAEIGKSLPSNPGD